MNCFRFEFLSIRSRIAVSAIALVLSVGVIGCPPVSTPTPKILLQPPSPSSCPNLVTLSDANQAASIYYTTDGSQPNTTVGGSTKLYSPNGTGPFQVNAPAGNQTNAIVSAVALGPGETVSPTPTQAFSCAAVQLPAAPVFSPAPGTYSCPFNVNVSDTTPGSQLLMNKSATPPSWNSHDYLGAFESVTVNSNTTFTAFAIETGTNPPASILLSQPPPSQAQYSCITMPFNQLVVEVLTGNDGLNQDSSVTITPSGTGLSVSGRAFCLKADNADCPAGPWISQSPPFTGFGWPNNVDTTITIPITPMTQAAAQSFLGTLQMQLTQGDPSCGNLFHEGCDNWRIQAINASLQGPNPNCTGPNCIPLSVPLLSIIGPSDANDDNCIVFLKAPPNATTVQFSLGGGTNSHIYMNGTSAENGITTTCKDNGDGGKVP